MNTAENSAFKKESMKSGTQSYMQLLKSVVLGTFIAMLVSIALLLIFAIAINSIFGDPDSVLNTFIIIAAVAGASAGGFHSSRTNGGRGLLCGAFTGISMSMILFLVMILKNNIDSEATNAGFRLVMVLFQIIFACIGGIIAVNTHKSKKTAPHYSFSKNIKNK